VIFYSTTIVVGKISRFPKRYRLLDKRKYSCSGQAGNYTNGQGSEQLINKTKPIQKPAKTEKQQTYFVNKS
jgi:hypothetical protein